MVHSLPMRLVRVLAVLACTAALVSACGDGEPSASAQEKFCSEYRSFYKETKADQGTDEAATVRRMKDFATTLADLDVPEQMSKEAASGLDSLVSMFKGLDANATQADVIALEKGMSKPEIADLDAFYLYSNKTCISGDVS